MCTGVTCVCVAFQTGFMMCDVCLCCLSERADDVYRYDVFLCCLSERVHDVYRCDVCLDVYRCGVCLCCLSKRDDDAGGVTCVCVAFHDA